MKKQIKQHQKRERKLQRQRLKELRGRRLGLYLHIPFCRQKCDYCDFYSLAGNQDRMEDYWKALTLHLEEVAPRTEGFTVDSVYIGGGTPSVFGEERLKRLLKTVDKRYHLDRHCESTVEVNPDSVTPRLLKTLRKAGANRISMGVQSCHDEELALVNRPHTFAQAQAAVEWVREAGFTNLNLDLIFGLPDQTMAGMQESGGGGAGPGTGAPVPLRADAGGGHAPVAAPESAAPGRRRPAGGYVPVGGGAAGPGGL